MNPKEITLKKFEKGFGYKPEEVDEYLKEVAVALASAMKEKEESEAKIVKLVERINEYRNDEDAIRDALLVAQKQGNRIIAEAKEEAEKIISQAQTRRDSLLSEVSADCEALKRSEIEKIAIAVRDENDKLNAVVAASKTQSELQTEKLNSIKAEVSDFKKKVLLVLEEQIKVVSALPELSDEEIKRIANGQVRNTQQSQNTSAQNAAESKTETKEQPVSKATFSSQSKTEAKSSNAFPAFGFGEGGYKKQDYSSSELKFGQNQGNKK